MHRPHRTSAPVRVTAERFCRGVVVATAGLTVGVAGAVSAAPASEASRDAKGIAFFERAVRPALAEQCYQCHSEGSAKGDLRLDSVQRLREATVSGAPLVEPGEPGKSALIQVLQTGGDGEKSPHHVDGRLVWRLNKWVGAGAPMPTGEAGGSEGKFWGYRPLRRPAVPETKGEWARTPVDRFVAKKRAEKGLSPVRDADRRTLIRRAYFDLLGLPPTPRAVKAFVDDPDPTPQAFEELVDRLLASPRFGERWGRHWLDVARYAESSGKEFNFIYPYAWPYRDYVIEAFNEDKPYDRFLREQIAGDLLPADSRAERDEQRIATGFLAIGPKRHNASGRTFRADIVDDQISTVGRGILGLTLGCARCHDHKFDPIPTEDYYALAGIFSSTKNLYGMESSQYSNHPADYLAYGPDAEKRYKAVKEHRKKLEETKKQLEKAKKKRKKLEKKLKQAEKKAKKDKGKKEGEGDTTKPIKKKLDAAKKNVEKLEQRKKSLKENPPTPPKYAMGVEEGKDPSDAKVAINGDPGDRGKTVPRGFVSAVKVENPPTVNPDRSGRRALAEWLTRPDHPLTSRVMVNRVWHHLFGRGIVPTVDNFGALGKPPTHPKLLDYLASRFVRDGWSVKGLIRRIMLSRTYQLSCRPDDANAKVDPQNTLLWRHSPRRLEVEPLRDAMLAVSGQLDGRPLEGSLITKVGRPLARRVAEKKLNPKSHRRTVYLPVVRFYPSEMLQLFDFPAPSLVVGERNVTTVPAQALYMLNDAFVLEQATHMAERVLREADGSVGTRVARAYRLAFARPPSAEEKEEARRYLQRAREAIDASDEQERRVQAWASLCQALMASAEFRYLVDAGGAREAEERPTRARTAADSKTPSERRTQQ